MLLTLWLTLAAAPTFNDIWPILERRCLSCHERGGIAPMRFETYAQTRPWAKAIRQAVATRRMPPWFAEPDTVKWANDPSLTAAERDAILGWIDAGSPAGKPVTARRPPKPEWTFPPDLILRAPKSFRVPAKAVVEYQYLVLPLNNAQDLWADRVEIRPSERSVVHHAVAYVRERDDEWLKDAPRGIVHVPPPRDQVTKADILAVYTPGAGPVHLPAGFAKKIPAGSDLVLQFHYTSTDKSLSDQTAIALGYAKTLVTHRVLTLQMGTDRIEIPPGERRHRISVSGTLPNAALLLNLMPHMHLRGSEFDFEILGAAGRAETLLRVKPFDFFWQLTYWLREPRLLKKGTRLRFTGYYDNSLNNPRNPDPSATVTWGEQSWQEMMTGFFDIATDPGVDKKAFFVRGGLPQ